MKHYELILYNLFVRVHSWPLPNRKPAKLKLVLRRVGQKGTLIKSRRRPPE